MRSAAQRPSRAGCRGAADPVAASFPARILPELGGLPAGQATGRAVLFEAATRWFRERCRPRGLLTVADDLHWADETSLALLAHLVRLTPDAPIVVLATLRPEAVGDRLDELRPAISRSGPGRELELGPLGAVEIGELVASLTGVAPDAATAGEIARLCGGNPFLAQELAISGLTPRGRGPDRRRLAWSVHDLVDARLAKLSDTAHELARWAAVLGETFDLDLLARASGLGPDEFGTIVGELVATGVVADFSDAIGHRARLQFRHALTQLAIFDRMGAAERVRRHATILRAADGCPEALSLEEALAHARGAGDRARIVELSAQAASRAVAQGALEDAEAHYRRPHELWRHGDGERVRAEIAAGWGSLAGILRPGAEAIELLLEARRLYAQLGDEVAAVSTQVEAYHVRWKAGDPAGARELVALVDALADAPPAALVRGLSGASSAITLTGGDPQLAEELATRGLELLSQVPDQLAALERLRLLNVVGMCSLQRGDFDRGRAVLEECGRLALDLGHPAGDVVALGNLAVIGQWDAAPSLAQVGEIADRALESARRRGMRAHEAWLGGARAALHLRAGELASAERALDAARAALSDAPDPGYARQLAIVVAQVALQKGELEHARDGFRAALEATHEKLDEAERDARLGLAHAQIALGEHDAALDVVAPWAPAAEERPELLRTYGSLLAAGVEAAAGCGDTRASSWSSLLTAHASSDRAAIAQAFVDLSAGRDVETAAVARATGSLEASGRRWEAARLRQLVVERAGVSTQLVPLAAAARAAFVEMGADGWARRSERSLRLAGEHVASRRTASNAAGVTARELEVLGLLAQGLSNTELAGRLHVSLPTVETHLRNVYRKLGARRRTEAVRAARELGLLSLLVR